MNKQDSRKSKIGSENLKYFTFIRKQMVKGIGGWGRGDCDERLFPVYENALQPLDNIV